MQIMSCMEEAKKYKVIARVYGSGRVTIPLEVRQYLHIMDGEFVELIVSKVDMSVPREEDKA